MGARVGIFDADVYGPSLPTMVSPELRILRMDPETRAITPTEYEGVSLVSFGFAGQGSAIMRGAMVSGLVQQMLTTTEWGAALRYMLRYMRQAHCAHACMWPCTCTCSGQQPLYWHC